MNKKLQTIIMNEPNSKFDEYIETLTIQLFMEAIGEFPDTYELREEIDSSNPEWEAGYLRGVEYATNMIKFLLIKDSLADSQCDKFISFSK